MKLLKYVLIFLVLASPVSAFEVGDRVKVAFLCRSESPILDIAIADIKSTKEAEKVAVSYAVRGICGVTPQMLDAIVNQVILDYTDSNRKVAQVVEVAVLHPLTNLPDPFKHYTILATKETGI